MAWLLHADLPSGDGEPGRGVRPSVRFVAEWALSDNNRRAKFYTLTPAGRKRLKAETERWNLAALALNKALRAQEI